MVPLLLSLWGASFRNMVLNLVDRSRAHLTTIEDQDLVGQGLVEYALILVMVAVVVIVVLTLMGPSVGNMFSNIVCGVFDAQKMECLS
jgi:pilus assembly protein Flp/PilA